MSRINGHLNLIQPQMAYVVAIALPVFLTAFDAHANQYSCIDMRNGAEVVVEASSITEAQYKARRERQPSKPFYT